jgi:hypothetical protein
MSRAGAPISRRLSADGLFLTVAGSRSDSLAVAGRARLGYGSAEFGRRQNLPNRAGR